MSRPVGSIVAGGVAGLLLLGGCTATALVGSPTPASSSDERADGAGGTTGQSASVDDPAVQDAILLTAVDEVLAGTRFADLVDEDPGAFLEAATTLCRRLDAGEDRDTVLRALLGTLEAEGLTLDEDTAYLGGALLGASVTVRCPQHEVAAEVAP